MADFVALLKKKLEEHNHPDRATRQQIYAYARTQVRTQLKKIKAPHKIIEDQISILEKSISQVEIEYIILKKGRLHPTSDNTNKIDDNKPLIEKKIALKWSNDHAPDVGLGLNGTQRPEVLPP